MLLFVAFLMGQLTPAEIKSPTFDEFRGACRELKREQVEYQRELLAQMKPVPDPVIKLTRSQKHQVLEDIKAKEAELKRIEKDDKLLPAPQLIVQSLQPGQIGELLTQISYADDSLTDRQGEKINVDKVETGPAEFTVLKTFRPNAIVCACNDVELVLLHHKGERLANGDTFEPHGIYRVSGTYKVGGKTYLSVEQWEHDTEWQKKVRRPEPWGRIDVMSKPAKLP